MQSFVLCIHPIRRLLDLRDTHDISGADGRSKFSEPPMLLIAEVILGTFSLVVNEKHHHLWQAMNREDSERDSTII